MTNERAIELLQRISDSQFDGEYGDERREALSMAVRALEGDGDTIYRQDAIDACCFGITHARAINVETGAVVDLFTESNKELHKAIERIEALPFAQPGTIRCKDCAKREYCRTTNVWATVPDDDWFCADAERRSDGAD